MVHLIEEGVEIGHLLNDQTTEIMDTLKSLAMKIGEVFELVNQLQEETITQTEFIDRVCKVILDRSFSDCH